MSVPAPGVLCATHKRGDVIMRKLTAGLPSPQQRILASPAARSFMAATALIWSPVYRRPQGWARVRLGALAVPLTLLAWAIVLSWDVFKLWLNGD
jgi:hypothetical protein